jgi:hypothetical protein
MSYDSGLLIASVVEPLRDDWYYEEPSDYDLVIAEEWEEYSREDFEIAFSLEQLKERYGNGVYTTVIWCEGETNDDGDNNEPFAVTSISLFL